jgi:trimethylamine:corrinoid methyltransferase-like protein
MHRVYGGKVDKVEGSHIVDARSMVLMLVREEYGIEVADTLTQHLLAEVGACVDDKAHTITLDHCRGAQTLITAIRRCANVALAAYYGHTLRCSCAEEC